MRNLIIYSVLLISLMTKAEVRLGSGNGKDLKIKSEELSRLVNSLIAEGFFTEPKIELQRSELFELVNEKSGYITDEGKKYLIIDADMIEKIQFVNSENYLNLSGEF